jgi:putative nucleotidyltransferase with HDIG domain
MFSSGTTATAQRKLLWRHSIGCATVARLLSEYIPGIDAQDAFLAGIFHDVGKLLFFDVVPGEYSTFERSCTERFLEQEESLFGTTHEEIGLKSAHTWGLPKEIKSAIGWHHRPDQTPVHSDIAAAIGFANALAKHWGIGSDESAHYDNQLLSKTQLSDERLNQVRERASEEFEETMSLWST